MRAIDERVLAVEVLPRAADAMRRAFAALAGDGVPVTIVQAARSLSQQARNVKSGASRTSCSYHLPRVGEGGLVRAVDVMWALDEDRRAYCLCGAYVVARGSCPRAGCDDATAGAWRQLGARAKEQGLFWGGDWKSLDDFGHVHLPGGGAVDFARARRT